jgi:hypothetical protein
VKQQNSAECASVVHANSMLIRRKSLPSCSRKAGRFGTLQGPSMCVARTFNVHEATIYRLAAETGCP